MVNIFKSVYEQANDVLYFKTQFPGLLHKLYCDATKSLGHDAPIASLFHHMNIEAR